MNVEGKTTKSSQCRFSFFTVFLLLLNTRSCFHFLLLQHISKNKFLYFQRSHLFSALEQSITLLKVEPSFGRLCKIFAVENYLKILIMEKYRHKATNQLFGLRIVWTLFSDWISNWQYTLKKTSCLQGTPWDRGTNKRLNKLFFWLCN